MTDPTVEQAIRRLVERGRDIMLEDRQLKRSSCVLATRMAVDALAYYHIDARPLSVEALVMSGPFWRAIEAGEITFATPPDDQPEGAYAVGVGTDTGEHVVAAVDAGEPYGTVLIDLSIDQAHHPKQGMPVGSLAVAAGRNWGTDDDDPLTTMFGETMIMYRARPDVKFWTKSPNWTVRDAARRRPFVAKIIAAMRTG